MLALFSKKTIFGILYRLAGVAGKFFLVIYITKEISLADLGIFNIFSTTVAWSVFLLGFEFHYYSTRDIIGEEKSRVGQLIYSQFLFHLSSLLIIPVIIIFLMANEFIPSSLIPYFIFITSFDQLSQEGARIMVGLNQFSISNKIYFIKNGLWIYFLFLFLLTNLIDITIETILAFWLLASILSFGIVVSFFYKEGYLKKENFKFDFHWIISGLRTCWPFLLATISALTVDYSNRYFIDYYIDKEAVGIFSFYSGIANIPITLITSVFVAQNIPLLVTVYKFEGENQAKKRSILKKFLRQNIVVTLVFIATSVVLIDWLLEFVGKRQLSLHASIFYLMLVQVFIFAVDSVVHTTLYSKRMDKIVLGSALAGALFNIVLNYILIPMFGLYGAVYSSIISLLIIFVIRIAPFIRKIWTH